MTQPVSEQHEPGSTGHEHTVPGESASRHPALTPSLKFWMKLAGWLAVLGGLIYVVLIPVVAEFVLSLQGGGADPSERLSVSSAILLRLMELIMSSWFFVLGAAIGSFLNVVVYRTPRGISLTHERSRCPDCLTPIRSSDNIPVVGWLRLGGLCRSCHAPVSARYPLVEMLVGLIFLLLYFSELISGGANLPFRPVNAYRGIVWVIFYTKWDLVMFYAFHCCTISCLLTWGLIAFDKQTLPWRAFLICVAIAMIASFDQFWLLPVPVSVPFAMPAEFPTQYSGITSSLVGLIVGGCTGILVNRVVQVQQTSGHESDEGAGLRIPSLVGSFILCGTVFGWQFVLVCALLTIAVYWCMDLSGRIERTLRSRLTSLTFACVVTIHLVCWRLILWPLHSGQGF
ncbi:MAG: prepilin peptidase [Planctomyces sp.]|nr:prepilin peptidase [Planctomyces sp.]